MISRREAMQAAVAASAVAIVPAPAVEVSDEEWHMLAICAGSHYADECPLDPDSALVVLAERLRDRGWVKYVEMGYRQPTRDGSYIDSYYTATDAGQQALRERAS